MFSEKPVDILISDIEMPGGSGLDLIAWIRDKGLNCVSLILSSFPDFIYAQRAISLSVAEYLLKPIDSEILYQSIRKAIQVRKGREEKKPETVAAVSDMVQKIQAYIGEHLTEEISRKEIADRIGFNPEYLSTVFNKEMKCSLSEYIQRERLSMAKKLLCQTNLSISLIAQNCGFETLSYFSSVFRQKEGMSPREYRKGNVVN